MTRFEAETLGELPDILIQARIARGLSQRELGDYLGLKEQQVQRYEAERYRSASLDRLVEVSDALGVRIAKRAELIGDTAMASVDPEVWQAFPLSEMYKRGWFEDFAGSLADARKAAADIIPSFLRGPSSRNVVPALHRKSVRASGQVHEAAIAAWEARVRRLAERDAPAARFDPALIDDAWLADLVALTLAPDGPARVIEHLRAIGIALVVEKHLPSTLLDGAALATLDGYAIIVAHIAPRPARQFLVHAVPRDWPPQAAISARVTRRSSTTPRRPPVPRSRAEADLFAQETLLARRLDGRSASRASPAPRQAVRTDAKRFGVGPAIIAGRVRREAQ